MTATNIAEPEMEVAIPTPAKKPRAPRVTKPPFNVITEPSGERFVELTNPQLVSDLRNCSRGMDGLWDKVPKVSVESLFDELPNIHSHIEEYRNVAALQRLAKFLETEFEIEMARINTMISSGVVSFGGLRLLLKPNTEIVIKGEQIQGGKVLETEYRHSMFGEYLYITYEYITSNGRTFSTTRDTAYVTGYRGVQDLNKLPVTIMTAEQKSVLTERGRRYMRLGRGSHYMHYTGHMGVSKWWSYTPMRANGRMMVDIFTHDQFKEGHRSSRDRDNTNLTNIAEDQLWLTEPYVNGFSFVTKQWGRFAVDSISEVDFRKEAYDQLVMDPERKAMVRALVEDSSSGFSDIIAGKGGGCIFLLHGEPGTGKTLTAEAIAELLHRPLYSVSVGELGTDTATLERSLRQILDVAQIWNAVILIDEADIFLEKRTSGDILRNAMVGIFLRLLEYHQGVMFLTTNRVREFDSAFHSRISVALRYAALTQAAREQIWANLLAAADIQGLDTAALSVHDINGRQIKNTIRLAQSLARQEGVRVAPGHITRCLGVSQQFVRDLAD